MGDLKQVGKELARGLRESMKTEVEISGSRLTLSEDSSRHLRVKDVKTHVKHILHHLGFSQEYRVLSEQSLIRIVRVEKKRRHVEKEGLAPAPSQSLPYLFPP